MATPVLTYATGTPAQRYRLFHLMARLLAPANVVVMFAIFIAHLLFWPLLIVVYAGVFFLVVAVPLMGALFLAHYGNVIEEFGPHGRDELPRPLRDLGFYEDLWATPFCAVFLSLLICYLPSILLIQWLSAKMPILLVPALILALIGTFFLPAIMLTLQTSGTILNLRPDRVLGVIGACGIDYWKTLFLWILTLAVYGFGWVVTTLAASNFNRTVYVPAFLKSWELGNRGHYFRRVPDAFFLRRAGDALSHSLRQVPVDPSAAHFNAGKNRSDWIASVAKAKTCGEDGYRPWRRKNSTYASTEIALIMVRMAIFPTSSRALSEQLSSGEFIHFNMRR